MNKTTQQSLVLPMADSGRCLNTVWLSEDVFSAEVRQDEYWRWLVFCEHRAGQKKIIGIQSLMLLEAPEILALPYMQIMCAALAVNTSIEAKPHVLQLGLGGGAINRFLNSLCSSGLPAPISSLTSVELNQKIINVLETYFVVGQSKQIANSVVCDDAWHYIQRDERQYELILCDLYGEQGCPSFMTSNDFMRDIASRLMARGVFVVNFISKEKAQLQPLFNALRSQFSHIRFLDVPHHENIVLYACRQEMILDKDVLTRLDKLFSIDIASVVGNSIAIGG